MKRPTEHRQQLSSHWLGKSADTARANPVDSGASSACPARHQVAAVTTATSSVAHSYCKTYITRTDGQTNRRHTYRYRETVSSQRRCTGYGGRFGEHTEQPLSHLCHRCAPCAVTPVVPYSISTVPRFISQQQCWVVTRYKVTAFSSTLLFTATSSCDESHFQQRITTRRMRVTLTK